LTDLFFFFFPFVVVEDLMKYKKPRPRIVGFFSFVLFLDNSLDMPCRVPAREEVKNW